MMNMVIKRRFLFLFFFLVLFVFCPFCVEAESITYQKGNCSNDAIIPLDAVVGVDYIDGRYVPTGYDYREYLKTTKVIDNKDGTLIGYANLEVENSIAFYKITDDGQNIVAYVPKYKDVVSNSDSKELLEFLGLYDKDFLSCEGTYIVTSLKRKTDTKQDSNKVDIEKVIASKDSSNKSVNSINGNIINNNQNTDEPSHVGNVLMIIIIIVMTVITAFLLKEIRNGKKDNKRILKVYLATLVIIIITMTTHLIRTSYALEDGEQTLLVQPNKVSNLHVVAKTSTSVVLEWDNDENVTVYQVCYKKKSSRKYNCNYTSLINRYVKTGLSANTTYQFKVRGKAKNSSKELVGSYSDVVKGKTYVKNKYYYYLSYNEKKTYNQIYNGVKKRKKYISITARYKVDTVREIFRYVRMDHPELFWMDTTYSYYYNSKTEKVTGLVKYYNKTFNDYKNAKKQFDAETKKIVDVAKTYKTDYEKEQYVAYALAKTVSYNYDAYNIGTYEAHKEALTQNAYSALVMKTTVCAGYSMAFHHIMSQLNVDVVNVSGYTNSDGTGRHQWNLVKLNDGYYNIDVTWMRIHKTGSVKFTYFNSDNQMFNKQHIRMLEYTVMPEASGTDYLGFDFNKIIDIENNDDSNTLFIGQNKKLTAKIDNNYYSESDIKWDSNNKNVLNIDQFGNATALRKGNARISLTSSDDVSLYVNYFVDEPQFSIAYDLDGGEVENRLNYSTETPTFTLKNPVKDGYIFTGWTGSNGSIPDKRVVIPKGSSGNRSYTANWESVKYIVSFNTNGGSYVDPISLNKKQKINPPEDPVKKGYTFIGWYKKSSLSDKYDFDDKVTKSMTLYASWKSNEYVMTFNTNGGSEINSIETQYGRVIQKPNNPVKSGYKFAGWYSDESLDELYTIGVMPSDDVTLYAKWASSNQNVISYETNGGINNTSNPTVYESGEELDIQEPTKTGSTFAGWYTDQSLESLYTSDLNVEGDITLYANWISNQYTISFDSNGGTSVDNITADFDSIIEAPTTPTKPNYKFTGWYTDENLQNLYTFSTMPSEDLTLYAGWVDDGYNVITYEVNGGINDDSNPSSYITGEEIELKDPVREGYEFLGWYLDESFNSPITAISSDMSGDKTLYAKWNAIKYSFVFDTNGGNDIDELTIAYGEKATKPDDPLKEGNTFDGWYSDQLFKNEYDFNSIVVKDTIIYAKWKEDNNNDTGALDVVGKKNKKQVQSIKVPNTGSVVNVVSIVFALCLIMFGVYELFSKRKSSNTKLNK